MLRIFTNKSDYLLFFMCACYCFDFECIVHLDILQLRVHAYNIYLFSYCSTRMETKEHARKRITIYYTHKMKLALLRASAFSFLFFLNFFLVRFVYASPYICIVYGMQNEQEKANNIHLVILFIYLLICLISSY